MNDNEFLSFVHSLEEHLKMPKTFVYNYARIAEVNRAMEIANELFPEMEIKIKDDPLQLGSLILLISGFDMTISGKREIELFRELISMADNFEIYPKGNENIKFSLMFNHALKRLKTEVDPQ